MYKIDHLITTAFSFLSVCQVAWTACPPIWAIPRTVTSFCTCPALGSCGAPTLYWFHAARPDLFFCFLDLVYNPRADCFAMHATPRITLVKAVSA